MLKKIKAVRKARQMLMNFSPGLYIFLSKAVSRTVLFKDERRLVRGKPVGGESDKAFVLYAANRAGSMLLGRTLAQLAGENGMKQIDLARYFVHTDRRRMALLQDEEWISKHLSNPGCFFGPFREPLPASFEGTLPSLAVIRDPRDIVVSHYYAVTGGHTVFDREFLAMKERAQAMEINEYALDYAAEAVGQAVDLWKLGRGVRGTAMRYEDILAGGSAALVEMAGALGLNPPSQALMKQFDDELLPPGTGDASQHKRSGAHGQFLTELKVETVQEFERRHGSELTALGYELGMTAPTTGEKQHNK